MEEWRIIDGFPHHRIYRIKNGKSWFDEDEKEKRKKNKKIVIPKTAKLNETKVREIRKQIAIGKRNIDIAAKYGVHDSVIVEIKKGRAWKHVD